MTEELEATAQGEAQGSVLRRLLKARNGARVSAGAAPAMPQAAPMTPARGAATAVSRAAEQLYGLPVKPLKITPGAATLAELAELLPEPALLTVVQGPGDSIGVVALCPAAVTALIEMQALGRVTSRPLAKRKLTASDAMLCADFINRLMAGMEAEISGLEGFEGFAGYRYASYLDDPRPLLLMMEEGSYRTMAMDLGMGGREMREAQIFVALPRPRLAALAPPARDTDAAKASPSSPAGQAQGQGKDPKRATQARTAATDAPTLAEAVQTAPVELAGILCRRSVSLAQLRALVPGSTLSLPRISLMDARIETRQGQLIAQGKLGEAEGCYAIRLHDPVAALTVAPAQADPNQDAASSRKPGWSASPGASGEGPGSALAPAASGQEPPIEDLADPDGFRADSDGAAVAKTGSKPA